MGHIFISYSHKDSEYVHKLADALQDEGFEVWIDDRIHYGSEWPKVVTANLDSSDGVIVVLSNNSYESDMVQNEVTRAREKKKAIFPLLLAGENWLIVQTKQFVDVSDGSLPTEKLYKRLEEITPRKRPVPKTDEKSTQEEGSREGTEKAAKEKIEREAAETADRQEGVREQLLVAGPRLKVIREELGLKPSQFIELIGVSSEREYKAMEGGEKEVPVSLLQAVSEVSGVNLDWLKHEEGDRYNVEEVSLRSVKHDLDYLTNLKPREYFLTLEKKSLHIGLIVQTADYRYQVIETGVDLKFWNWVDEHWAISAFYHFLKDLSDPWHDIDGVILPAQFEKKLFKGEIHFLVARRNAERYGRNLLYDLLDFDETRGGVASYSRRYGWNWMHRVHEEFKYYLNAEAARKASAESRRSAGSLDHVPSDAKDITSKPENSPVVISFSSGVSPQGSIAKPAEQGGFQGAGSGSVASFDNSLTSAALPFPRQFQPRPNFEPTAYEPSANFARSIDYDLLIRFALGWTGSNAKGLDSESKWKILEAIEQNPVEKWMRLYTQPVLWGFADARSSTVETICSPIPGAQVMQPGTFDPNFKTVARFWITLDLRGIVLDVWLKETQKGEKQPAWYPLSLDVCYGLLLTGAAAVTDPVLRQHLPVGNMQSPRVYTHIKAKDASWLHVGEFQRGGAALTMAYFELPAEFHESERIAKLDGITKDEYCRLLTDFGCMDHEAVIRAYPPPSFLIGPVSDAGEPN